MKKLFWILLTGFLGISVPSLAQVTSVSILGVGSGGPGQSVPVTFVITNTNLFYDVNYDILFSPSSSVTNTAYSSFLKGPMVCSGDDAGYNFSSGTLATTIIQNATVPGYQYSGYVVVIADENQPYLTCASTSANTAFTMVPTPTATCTNTPTNTTTATATKTPTNTITQTPTATATNTITRTPTNTKTPTATATKTATNTATSTATNTATATPSSTPTAFFTYTITQTPTITNTPFYPQVNANVFVQVTATGTVTGQNVWIPQPPGWGGAGGVTVSGSVSVTGGQIVAIPPSPTNTFTPTPTGSPTGTPTNTPTPIYFSGPMTIDSLSGFVTLAGSPINIRTYSLQVMSNGALTYASPATILIDTSLDGVNWHAPATIFSVAVSVTSTADIGHLDITGIQTRWFRVRMHVTPVATGSIILELLGNYTSIPEEYRHLFQRSKDYDANDPCAERSDRYTVYYDPRTKKPVRVHSWG